MESKICTKCKELIPLDSFRKKTSTKDGIDCICKKCNAEIQRKWYANNKAKAQQKANDRYALKKEEINARRKELRKQNPEKYRAFGKQRYHSNKNKFKEYSWKAAGIKSMTVEKYKQLYLEQNGCCAICKTSQENLNKTLCVDHDHATGEIRGLLCDSCNRALGYLKDSVDLLEASIVYLKKSER